MLLLREKFLKKSCVMPSLPAIKPIDPPSRPGPGGWNIWVAASQGDIPRVTVFPNFKLIPTCRNSSTQD